VTGIKRTAKRLRGLARALTQKGDEAAPPAEGAAAPVLDEYVAGMPSAQNAVDCLGGWNTALPPEIGVQAGHAALYNDPRILWAIGKFGSLAGKRVLELGPLEASHTYMLEQRRPMVLHAVEANKLSFLRCLIVKELLGLRAARFYLGDFAEWLRQPGERYDFIIGSGVLYHMADPIELLELIAARADAFFLWTHYASETAMAEGDPRRSAFVGDVEVVSRRGVDIRLYGRSYWGAWKNKAFCGGMHDLHRWIERDDILAFIRALGFDEIDIAFDDPAHQNGPSFAIFARRTRPLPVD